MKIIDADSAITHFEEVLALSQSLRAHGVAVYHHRWDCLVMGSWTLIAGTRRRAFEFQWDGREGYIQVQGPHAVEPTGPRWNPFANENLGLGPDVDPLGYVIQFFQSGRHEQ